MNIQKQRTIFITGSSSGLGRAAAKLFASKGWKVIATMRNPDAEKELTKIPNVTLMALDVTNPEQIKSVAEKVISMGSLDVVFNNAGYGIGGPLEARTDEQILRAVETNMLGAIRTTKAFPLVPAAEKRNVHQHHLHWWLDDRAIQLYVSRHEVGTGRLGRKHGLRAKADGHWVQTS